MSALAPWPYPLWVAHRGAGRLAPENTLAAFREGARHGYRMFECDAKLSADGQVFQFLLHALDGLGRVAGMQFHLDAWVVLPEAAEDVVQKAVAGGDRAIQRELAMQDQLVLLECLTDGLPAIHDLLGISAKLLPFAGQADRAVVAQE